MSRAPASAGSRVCALLSLVSVASACAPIEARSQVSVRPREAPALELGEERVSHEFTADYVQMGTRLLVELRELDECVALRHVPVLRVEQIERSSKGFVAWDFSLGVASSGFAALAFAQPRLFTKPLVDGQGRVVYNHGSAYVIGGVFAALGVGLLTAGVVNALRARDTATYADAYEVARGEPHACAGADQAGAALAERELILFVAGGVLEARARTDAGGRARFELPAWPPELDGGLVPAQLEISRSEGEGAESKLLELTLRAPFVASPDAHTGRADTREVLPPTRTPAVGVEGPMP